MRSRDVDTEMIRARADSLRLAIRQTDVSSRVAGNGDVPLQVLQGLAPVALDGAIGRVVADVRPFAVLYLEGGLQHDVLIARRKTCGNGGGNGGRLTIATVPAGFPAGLPDAAKVLISPREQIAQQHHMIATIHLGRGLVAVPQLPDGRGSVFRHIAPRRVGLGGCQTIGYISEPVVRQSSHQPRNANDTTRDVVLVLDADVLYDLTDNVLLAILRHNAKGHGQYVCRNGVVAIEHAVRIEHMTRTGRGASLDGQELLVERLRHLLADRTPIVSLTAPLLHQLQGADDVGRRDERHVRLAGRVLRMDEFQLFRGYAPVGIFATTDDAITTVLLDDVLHPLLDIWIAVLDGLTIAILSIEHIARERQCCRPRHIVGIVVPEGGCHIRNATIRALCLTNIAHPLGIEAFVVKEERLAQRPHRAVAQPRLPFVTLWTVDRHSLIIVKYAPPGILHDLVQCGVRAFKVSCGTHFVSHHFGHKIVLRGIL